MKGLHLLLTVEGYADPPRISDLGFEVNSGELVLLLGSSGSGKSRLLDSLAGLGCSRGGRILIAGEPPSNTAARGRCSYVFQQDNFDGDRPVRTQMCRRLRLYGFRRDAAGAVVADWAHTWRIRGMDGPAKRMDLGSLQAASLGLGLLPKTDLVVLDEPAQNLGPSGIELLLEHLGSCRRRAVLALVSPPTPLARIADRVVYVGEGGER